MCEDLMEDGRMRGRRNGWVSYGAHGGVIETENKHGRWKVREVVHGEREIERKGGTWKRECAPIIRGTKVHVDSGRIKGI
jgi:hypothetical protein